MHKRHNTTKTLDQEVVEVLRDLPPVALQMVLEDYRENMAPSVRASIDALYKALDSVRSQEDVEAVKAALSKVKVACDANPQWEDLFPIAEKQAKDRLAKAVAHEDISFLD